MTIAVPGNAVLCRAYELWAILGEMEGRLEVLARLAYLLAAPAADPLAVAPIVGGVFLLPA
jgi:hypothetical protein